MSERGGATRLKVACATACAKIEDFANVFDPKNEKATFRLEVAFV